MMGVVCIYFTSYCQRRFDNLYVDGEHVRSFVHFISQFVAFIEFLVLFYSKFYIMNVINIFVGFDLLP